MMEKRKSRYKLNSAPSLFLNDIDSHTNNNYLNNESKDSADADEASAYIPIPKDD
jgi:hypothetical protein